MVLISGMQTRYTKKWKTFDKLNKLLKYTNRKDT